MTVRELIIKLLDEPMDDEVSLIYEKEHMSVLDKVRAEVEQLRLHKAQFLTNDNKVCIDSQEALAIIDKYRKEHE